MIRAVVSDFGGVLTNPLFEGFLHVQEQAGVAVEDFGAALGRLAERDGENPLFALERGEVTEEAFLADLGAELGHDVSAFSEQWFAACGPTRRCSRGCATRATGAACASPC